MCSTRDSRYYSGIDFDDFVESVDELNRKGMDFIISYDGLCGEKQYGNDLPQELGLTKILLNAGWSSQALLFGRKEITYEALYLSPNLAKIEQPVQSQLELAF